jgi:hypothetical protein
VFQGSHELVCETSNILPAQFTLKSKVFPSFAPQKSQNSENSPLKKNQQLAFSIKYCIGMITTQVDCWKVINTSLMF